MLTLQVLLSVEGNLFGLHLAVLDVHLVPAQNDGDALAHADEVLVPVGHVLVGHSRSNIEHDDSSLSLDAEPESAPYTAQ